MQKKLWDLFKATGDIRYYNLLNSIEGSKRNENRESRRTNNR